MQISLNIEPPTATAQEKKYTVQNGRAIVYKSNNAKIADQKLRIALMPYRPRDPLDGPLSLCVCWVFTWPKSMPKSKRVTYKVTRPDTDNLNKGLKDVMTGLGFWHDDAQVCMETITKTYADVPGIHISIEKLTEDNDG